MKIIYMLIKIECKCVFFCEFFDNLIFLVRFKYYICIEICWMRGLRGYISCNDVLSIMNFVG